MSTAHTPGDIATRLALRLVIGPCASGTIRNSCTRQIERASLRAGTPLRSTSGALALRSKVPCDARPQPCEAAASGLTKEAAADAQRTLGASRCFSPKCPSLASRQAVAVRGDLWVGEERSPWVGARSAHPYLTRRRWLSAANEVSAASSAARPKGEHHSAVGATGDDRPSMSPGRVPPVATRRPFSVNSRSRTPATGRERKFDHHLSERARQ